MTSAPRSARCTDPHGPAPYCSTPMMRMSSSGFTWFLSVLPGWLTLGGRGPTGDVGDDREQLLLRGARLFGGEAAGGRTQLDGVDDAVVRVDRGGHLIRCTRDRERLDHGIGDEVAQLLRGDSPGTEGVDDLLLVVGEAVEREEVGVGAHRRVEPDDTGREPAGLVAVGVDRRARRHHELDVL